MLSPIALYVLLRQQQPPAAAPTLAEEGTQSTGKHASQFDGVIELGWRYVAVFGSDAQYAEDQNLDTGAVLRELSLEQRRGDRRAWSFDVRGVGDPRTYMRADIDGAWLGVHGRYDRSEFAENTDSDLHAFDIVRETASLRFERAPTSVDGVRAGIEIDYLHRNGMGPGTRSVDFGYVSDVATRLDEHSVGVRGDVAWTAMGWQWSSDLGVERLAQSDERDFVQPSPSDPNSTQTEDFEAASDGNAVSGALRAAREFGDTQVDAGLELFDSRLDGDLHSFETGILIDPASPFERTTDGDSDLAHRAYQLDAGLRHEIDTDLAVLARFWHGRETDDAELSRYFTLNSFSGPPSSISIANRSEDDRSIDLLELGVDLALTNATDLTATVSTGRDDIHVLATTGTITTRAFDAVLDRHGHELTLDSCLTRVWQLTISAGDEVEPIHNSLDGTGFDFFDDEATFVSARAKWSPSIDLSFTTLLKHRSTRSDAFDSHGETTWLSFATSSHGKSGWIVDAGIAFSRYDLEANTTILLLTPGPTQVPTIAHFEGTQSTFSGSVAYELHPRFHPQFGGSLSISDGDGDYRYGSLYVVLPYRIADATTCGIDLDLRGFDALDASSNSDFDSVAATAYVRQSF